MSRPARIAIIVGVMLSPLLALLAYPTSGQVSFTPQVGVESTVYPFYLPVVLQQNPSPTATQRASPTPTVTRSPFPYTLQNGSPAYISNFANTAGCQWQGIAGQVFNLSNQSVIGLIVHLEGGGLNVETLTGAKPEYGPSGWEFFLTDPPQTTTDVYHVQLRTIGGSPLSDVYVIPTFANPPSGGCPKNLALVNFVQNH
jgi:hypothetical protein